MTAVPRTAPPPLPAAAPPAPVAKKGSLWPGLVGGLAVGAVIGFGAATLGALDMPSLQRTPLEKVLTVAVIVLAVGGTTLVHELGHLAGGVLAGWTPYMLIWGPFKFVREEGRWRTHQNRSAALAGGMALAVPDESNGGDRQAAMMILGGPVASLLLGVACLAAHRLLFGSLTRETVTFGSLLAAETLAFAGIASLGVFAATMIPARTGGFLTDGARLLRLLRGGPTAARDRAMMTLVGLSVSATRPRDWPRSLVQGIGAARDGSPFDSIGPLFEYLARLDAGDLPAAHAALLTVHERLETVPEAARGSYATEFAFYELVVRGDRERGRAWLDLYGETAFDDRLVRPMLAAVADGDRATALRHAGEIERRSGTDGMRAELVRAALG